MKEISSYLRINVCQNIHNLMKSHDYSSFVCASIKDVYDLLLYPFIYIVELNAGSNR